MKCISVCLALAMLAVPRVTGEAISKRVSLVQLIVTPEKFDGALVTVQGFLVLGVHHDLIASVLYMHKEDADNLLTANAVLIIPSREMQESREKFNDMYVLLTGSFKAVRSVNGTYVSEIKDIQDCGVWSDPSRPVGLKGNSSKPEKQ